MRTRRDASTRWSVLDGFVGAFGYFAGRKPATVPAVGTNYGKHRERIVFVVWDVECVDIGGKNGDCNFFL